MATSMREIMPFHDERYQAMCFDLALCVLKAGFKATRDRRQDYVSMQNGRLYVTPAVGATTLWVPTQDDILAADWMVMR